MRLSLFSLLLCCSFSQAAEPLQHITVEQAGILMQQQKLSSVELTQYYLTQIARVDDAGPQLNAIVDINPDALQQAAVLDEERKAGKIRSALHGMPVVLKANIATADKLPTTAGALALKDFTTTRDAALVTQLRSAGAVILAKANLSEWANFRGEGSASGWSALGGQTKNPYLLTHSPCGSSSGSGVAVAADLTLLAVGTETDGSIVCPASMNAVVGIKPTRGSVAGAGIIPIADSQDIAGPMARTVADAAALLEVLQTSEAQQKTGPLQASAWLPKKVVLVRAFDKDYPAVKLMLDKAEAALLVAGVQVQTVQSWQLPAELYQDELQVLVYEFGRDLARWLTDYQAPEQVNTVQKLVDFNHANGKAALAFYGQDYLQQAATLDLTKEHLNYQKALKNSRVLAEQQLDLYLKQAKADLILIPSYGPSWPIDHVKGDSFSFGTSTAAAVAGYPNLSLPGGFAADLPLGLSLIGLPWSEQKMISTASFLEQKLQARKAPEFLQQAR
ncbi:amidase [Rheinheimera sediminis]|uniref:amidase n=1 Tax=Rheinheimera sp. YQF-1 TaxID=2499626 RepID=UPI000FDCDD49|nr:amidase [Rheinheimera sp. YQF-1]RVT45241.1 amidase [Rheinheimera sp. YQF-1]